MQINLKSLINKNINWITMLVLYLAPKIAFAQSSESPVGQGLSYITNALYGTDGVVICTIAIMGVGLLCLAHKLEWTFFIKTVAGVALLFGAGEIVSGIQSLVHNS